MYRAIHRFPGKIADVDELTVPASDGVPLHVSCTGKGADVLVLPVAPDACTTSRARNLHPPVSGHGSRIPAAWAAPAGARTTWRGLWRT